MTLGGGGCGCRCCWPGGHGVRMEGTAAPSGAHSAKEEGTRPLPGPEDLMVGGRWHWPAKVVMIKCRGVGHRDPDSGGKADCKAGRRGRQGVRRPVCSQQPVASWKLQVCEGPSCPWQGDWRGEGRGTEVVGGMGGWLQGPCASSSSGAGPDPSSGLGRAGDKESVQDAHLAVVSDFSA